MHGAIGRSFAPIVDNPPLWALSAEPGESRRFDLQNRRFELPLGQKMVNFF